MSQIISPKFIEKPLDNISNCWESCSVVGQGTGSLNKDDMKNINKILSLPKGYERKFTVLNFQPVMTTKSGAEKQEDYDRCNANKNQDPT